MSDHGNPDPTGSSQPYRRPPHGQPLYGAPRGDYAHWVKRVGGTLVDWLLTLVSLIPFLVGYGILASTATRTTRPDGTTDLDLEGGNLPATVLMILGFLFTVGFFVWNTFLLQGRTGATLGKSALGISLVKESTGRPIGAGKAFLRHLVHQVTDGLCLLGYLWPLWDRKRQTWADKILGTVVVNRSRT